MAAIDVVNDLDLDAEDTTGDGVVDYGEGDSDGNGMADIFANDFNQDGVWDHVMVDADEDGVLEREEIDEDYDGLVDRIAHYDADGFVVATEVDTDCDGVFDQMVEDTDGDGIMDTFSYDTDGDGQADEVNEVADPFVGLGGVYGDAEPQYYQEQQLNGECGPTSAAMVISEQLGEFVPYQDVVDTTLELGLMNQLDDGSYDGSWSQNMVDVLAAYGVEAGVEHGDLAMLESYLADGRDVMVTIDSAETWGDRPDGATADHMVVVTQVDEVNGTVTLNDPGNPDGESMVVPLETFVNAWADDGNTMIVTATAGADEEPGTDVESDDTTFDIENLDDLFGDHDGDTDFDFNLDELFGAAA